LAARNDLNSGTISNDESFLIIGNNNNELRNTGSTEFPAGLGIFSRISREWKLTNTNFDDNFSIDITLSTQTPINANDIAILVDFNESLGNAVLFNPSVSVNGNVITISGLNTTQFPLNSTRFFTVVSLSPGTPLPGEVSLL
jgi:hypothetical protein